MQRSPTVISTPTVIPRVLNRKLEMMRRISPEEADAIDRELKELPKVEETISALAPALDQTQWEQSEHLNNPKMPYYALLAYQQGAIQRNPFATYLLYCSARERHGREKVKTCLLFENKEINLEHKQLIAQTLKNSFLPDLTPENLKFMCDAIKKILPDAKDDQIIEELKTLDIALADEQFAEFYEEMKKLPHSEQRFLLVPDEDKQKGNISIQIEQTNFNVFGRVDGQRMVASLGMMQTYLKVKFKKQACAINPVLGSSSLKDIEDNGLSGQRDMAIPFPGVSLPEEADYFIALFYIFSYHDFYHAYVASCVPDLHRQLMTKLGRSLLNYVKEKNSPYNAVDSLFEPRVASIVKKYSEDMDDRTVRMIGGNFLDMEHFVYRYHSSFNPVTPADYFWITVSKALSTPQAYEAARYVHEKLPQLAPLTTHAKFMVLTRIFTITDKEDKDLAQLPENRFQRMFEAITKQTKQLANLPHFSFPEVKTIEEKTKADYVEISDAWYKLHILDQVDLLFAEVKKEQAQKLIKEKISPYIDVSNVVNVFQKACEHKHPELQQCCMMFMAKNLKELMKEPSFKELQRSNPKRVKAFIKKIQESHSFKELFKMAAEDKKSDEMLELLLSPGVNQLDADGFTPLDYAIKWGNINLVGKLLDRGASLYPQPGSKALPSLFSAIYHAHGKIFDLLRRRGFNMEFRHQGLSWKQFFEKCCADPNTNAGIAMEFKKSMAPGGLGFTIGTASKAKLFAQAKKGAPISDEQELSFLQVLTTGGLAFLSDTPTNYAAFMEQYYAHMIDNISWACKRLPEDDESDKQNQKSNFTRNASRAKVF